MARKQSAEVERWPEVPDEEYWSDDTVVVGPEDRWDPPPPRRRPEARATEPPDERWDSAPPRRRPAAEPEEDRWDSAPGRRRTGRLRVEVPPIVNPYAIVALVAALLGLFPVAIVFGLIAFSHPRGRVMAMSALLLGLAEVLILAAALVLSGIALPHTTLRTVPAALSTDTGTATTTTTHPVVPTTTVATPSSTAAPTTTAAPTGPVSAAKGEVCTQAQAALIGAATDGSTLLCLHGSGGYRWTGPYSVSTAVYEGGAKCDPTIDKTARTPDGHALVCEGQGRTSIWSLWVE
ncbi:DUF4190 domain-containing protein [Nocardia veterana]|uniref:DUF4190 domain-containing protein n=1 Tax=Nocardia veterana TaxID=132249 RepID=A0A7X6RGT7_9NOCA|nr:DUF4190 domain-containing protein [Nocardia veterana]NKY85386.1 DUF4190 domain-containing protein [Nocardia veterana]